MATRTELTKTLESLRYGEMFTTPSDIVGVVLGVRRRSYADVPDQDFFAVRYRLRDDTKLHYVPLDIYARAAEPV